MLTVVDVFKIPKNKLTKGEVGIEVEVEGTNLPRDVGKYWGMDRDGSLQGDEATEYILREPMSAEDAEAALDFLQKSYKSSKSSVRDSVRAGVHIHINVQKMNMLELYNFMTLYLVLEEVLVRWCGPTREGNLFCLRASDAEWLIRVLRAAIKDRNFPGRFYDDDIRYASMNVKALVEHGSLEFRAMRGVEDLSLVALWMRMLLKVRDKSLTFEDPRDIISGFSNCTYTQFLDNVMEEYAPLLSGGDTEVMLFNGMRNAQDIAYATKDWRALLELVGTNPFKKRLV